MSERSFYKPLLVDDYIMYTLERIREARLQFADFLEELSEIKSGTHNHGVPLIYEGVFSIEGQTAIAESNQMIAEVLVLENELIRHLGRLISMPDVTPLRQLDWHLELSVEELTQVIGEAANTPALRATSAEELRFDEAEDYIDDRGDAIIFGYPPALLLEALYWPLSAARRSA